MTRYIEILNEQNELKELTTEELPFEVVYASSINKKSSLLISKVDNNNEDIKNITYAYIAQDEGHLFFQPAAEQIADNEINIFHNDEAIEKSVWLKSGDILQIEDKIIIYKVSGDKIQIKVADKSSLKSKPELIPPPPYTNHLDENNIEALADVELQSDLIPSKNKIIKKRILIAFSIILLLMAGFIILAETVRINIEPGSAKIELTGLFPILKINKHYILLNGEYDLTANKAGYKTLNKSLYIDTKNKEFSFALQEKPGLIEFNITPENNNKIYIDNVFLGGEFGDSADNIITKRDNIQYEINKGQHNLVVTNPRYKKFEQLIKVEGINKLQQFNIELEPNWADVTIVSETENTLIKIYSDLNDEEPVYENELIKTKDIELVAGHYTVILNKEKYKEKKENLSINAGDKKNIHIVKLEPADAQINLTSEPTGSIISIDNQYMGKTPQTIELSPYVDHKISLSLSGHKDITKMIKLEADEISEQNYILEALKGIVFISVVPQQAQLFIDGKKQKETSGKFSLGGNNHTIIVKAKGYKTQTKKINASSYSKSISFNLEKKDKAQRRYKQNSQVNSKKMITNHVNTGNYINSISQKMILVKPAEFVMGSKKNEAGRGSNERQYKVKLNQSYYLSEKEITNKQFRAFKASHNSGRTSGVSLNNDNQPIVNLSWNEAAKFTNWLSKKEGLNVYYEEINKQMTAIDLSGKINGYRLPHEAEWAYAARGKNQKKYPWLGKFPPQNVSGNFADQSASSHVSNIIPGYNDQSAVSAPVGSYNKNAAGFYDLGGNVSEWCQDYYSPFASSTNKIVNNPTGPAKGTHKVVRDSSWRDASMTELRLSYRSYSKNKAKDIGFRIARYAQ